MTPCCTPGAVLLVTKPDALLQASLVVSQEV